MEGIKDQSYFDNLININHKGLIQLEDAVTSNKVPKDRMIYVRYGIFSYAKNILYGRISRKDSKEKISSAYRKAVIYLEQSWDPERVKIKHEGELLNQYDKQSYVDMLWLIAIGIIIDIEKKDLEVLIKLIDRDSIRDYLYEYLIQYINPQRENVQKESYFKFRGINEQFGKLKEIIQQENNSDLEKELKEYLDKDWYSGFKDYSWYDSHKSNGFGFFGYWCFSIAAIVKIEDLNLDFFGSSPYFPKQLF